MKNAWTVPIAVAVFVFAGCSNRPIQASGPVSQPASTLPPQYTGRKIPPVVDVKAGGDLFTSDCVSCHGESGHGDGPASQALLPPPANLVTISGESADDFMFWKIEAGVDATAMPAWKGILTDQQVWQLIAFIRTLK